MKWLLATVLALPLAGCADHWNLSRPIELVTPREHILSLSKPVLHKSIAATPEAPPMHVKEGRSNASLIECISSACKEQCSATEDSQSRPKWCVYFRVPIDGHG